MERLVVILYLLDDLDNVALDLYGYVSIYSKHLLNPQELNYTSTVEKWESL